MSKEFGGGKVSWSTARQSEAEIKKLIVEHVQGDLETRAGVKYEIDSDRIVLVDIRTYKRILKAAEARYSKWMEHS